MHISPGGKAIKTEVLFSSSSRSGRRRARRPRPRSGTCTTSSSPTPSLGPHRREQQHLLDVVDVGEEHRHPVDAHAPASRRGKTVFQGRDERLVDGHRLVVSAGLGRGLLLEPKPLRRRVVELGVGVADLAAVDKQLEALSHPWLVPVPLGQRAHRLRVVADEARIHELALEELAHELVQQARRGPGRGALDAALDAEPVEQSARRLGLVLARELDAAAEGLLESREHADAPPGRGEVDLDGLLVGAVGVVADDVASAVDLLDLLID